MKGVPCRVWWHDAVEQVSAAPVHDGRHPLIHAPLIALPVSLLRIRCRAKVCAEFHQPRAFTLNSDSTIYLPSVVRPFIWLASGLAPARW